LGVPLYVGAPKVATVDNDNGSGSAKMWTKVKAPKKS